MRWTDEMRMETPEQIELDLELAGLGSRFLAMCVDWIFKFAATFLVLVLFVVVLAVDPTKVVRDASIYLIAVVIFAIGAFWLGYGTYFEVRWNGQTPGKWLAKIRAIREGGAPVDFQAAGIRNLLTVVYLVPIFYLIDAVLILATARHQRLGDLAAGTIVIRERAIDLGDEPEEEMLEYASPDYAFTSAHLESLTANDRAVLREFLRRYRDMTGRGRRRLAWTLAEGFARRTRYPLDDDTDARVFLASLLRDLQEYLKHC